MTCKRCGKQSFEVHVVTLLQSYYTCLCTDCRNDFDVEPYVISMWKEDAVLDFKVEQIKKIGNPNDLSDVLDKVIKIRENSRVFCEDFVYARTGKTEVMHLRNRYEELQQKLNEQSALILKIMDLYGKPDGTYLNKMSEAMSLIKRMTE